MLMHDQHLYKSPPIEVYGHCRLLSPWLRGPCWFFEIRAWKIPGMGIEPITLDLSSQLGAYDLSATPIPTC